jgi:2-succinyl-5-enolpyruvyl-6-hydroxy-3-cyclohexene-1-carboxylate synthase
LDIEGRVDLVNTSTQLARNITKQIIENGVTDVVLSPGSRNAPLSIALYNAEQEGLIKLHVRIDERTGGFFALGISKASGRPVAVVCTSGTAVAKYHPSVLEAHHSQVPLLVITADRPERLRQSGANQTTLQAKIYSEATPFALDFSDPKQDLTEAFEALLSGPVHLNVQFDEPLLPDDEDDWLRHVVRGDAARPAQPKLRNLLISESRGVVVVGHDRGGLGVKDISNFAQRIGWPLVCEDPLSFPNSVPHASLFLTSLKIRQALLPEVVIVVGRTTLSRSMNALIASAKREIAIDPRIATIDINRNADQIFLALPSVTRSSETDDAWLDLWNSYADETAMLVEELPGWSEASIARTVAELLPDESTLFVSSSRPIRDLEGFAASRGNIETFANRGLAGIDGNISTALGIASQRSSTVAVLGDLSFLHDVTGLIGAGDINLRVLVINNDGGGIFSTLPQHNAKGFEKLFGTPHGLDPALIAASMGIPSTTITSIDELQREMLEPVIGLSVVVARVRTREENARMLLELYQGIESI